MGDRQFTEQVRRAKQAHERYVTAILACDVFPGLDRSDPLASSDEDLIPEKFGPKWFEYTKKSQQSERPRAQLQLVGVVDQDGKVNEENLDALLQSN